MSSPHEQPTVATPSDERNEMNDGHAEQSERKDDQHLVNRMPEELRFACHAPSLSDVSAG